MVDGWSVEIEEGREGIKGDGKNNIKQLNGGKAPPSPPLSLGQTSAQFLACEAFPIIPRDG